MILSMEVDSCCVRALKMKISGILRKPSVRIVLFLHERGEVRYTDLTNLIASRGTLSSNLKELDEEEMIQRRIVATKPIQAYYSLTERSREVAKRFSEIKRIIHT